MSKRIAATKLEKEHIGLVKTMPCIICSPAWFMQPPLNLTLLEGYKLHFGFYSEYHHITDARGRLGHMFGLPLCENHHRGVDGFSGINRSSWDKSLKNQLFLLGQVYNVLGIEAPPCQTKIVPRKIYENSLSN